MTRKSSATQFFEVLANSSRRQLLFALLEADPESDITLGSLNLRPDRSGSDDDGTDRLQLIHNHLPRLDDLGYIDWDRETEEISKGPNWDKIASLLHLIRDHQDELPDEWP